MATSRELTDDQKAALIMVAGSTAEDDMAGALSFLGENPGVRPAASERGSGAGFSGTETQRRRVRGHPKNCSQYTLDLDPQEVRPGLSLDSASFGKS